MVELNDKGFLPRADVESEGGSGEGNHDSVLRRIFVGAGGLRLGWSVAVYWVMFGVIAAVENWLADSLQLGKLWSQMFGELGVLVAAVIPALVMARIERRPWGDYGLPLRQAFQSCFGWAWFGGSWALRCCWKFCMGCTLSILGTSCCTE